MKGWFDGVKMKTGKMRCIKNIDISFEGFMETNIRYLIYGESYTDMYLIHQDVSI